MGIYKSDWFCEGNYITLWFVLNSWIFFLSFSIADECTSSTCPEMTAGPHYTYLWTDSRGSDPISVFIWIHHFICRWVQMSILILYSNIFQTYLREHLTMSVKMEFSLMILWKLYQISSNVFSECMHMFIIIIWM